MEWATNFIKMWNFAPNNVPKSIQAGRPDTQDFGTPTFNTEGGNCVIEDHFWAPHQIVINTGFCGYAAGKDSVWQQTTCHKSNPTKYKTCSSYVAANPDAFAKTYWLINSVKVFRCCDLKGEN